MTVTIRPAHTDDDYEAWRQVRIAVVPYERCATTEHMRATATPTRILLLAEHDGALAGSGLADRSDSDGIGFVAPRVLPDRRGHGVGDALLRALAEHVMAIGLRRVRTFVDDPEALGFATHYGFVETDRQIEQIRPLGSAGEAAPEPPLPPGVTVVTAADRPELWAACYERFGREVLADFAVATPLDVTRERWIAGWLADPMFLAVVAEPGSTGPEGTEVIGCAGYDRDTDTPERGECALTAVRRDWRGRGIAAHLKRLAERHAATAGLAELYTWTQTGNGAMRGLNEKLGYAYGHTSITVGRDLPL